VLAIGSRFFESYDFAVIGTVSAIRTDERQGSATYGATEVDVVVAAVLGVDEGPPEMTLRAGDPEWMVGWPFEVGASYFVPVDGVGPERQANWTFGCDPVTQVENAAATVARLAASSGYSVVPNRV
jgi:hypothetical protein